MNGNRKIIFHEPSVLIATLGGLGFHSSMPGTLGSGAACLVSLAVPVPWPVILLAAVIGVWASDRAARVLGETDPGCVVIDEVVGMWLSVLLLPGQFVLAGFFLFRIVDIVKPFPVSTAERLPGGLGIMADDIAGGILVNLFLQALNAYFWHSGWLYALFA